MTKKLKHIAPVKFGLVVGIIYGLTFLVIVPFFLLAIIISSFAHQPDSVQQGFSLWMRVVLCFLLPILYAVIGGLFGMLAAWIYNIVAGWTGGIEFVVE